MQWSQRHTQISSLCPSLVCSGSLPSALQLRWLWFPYWPALPKRPRLPRSALWRAWQPPRVALRWGAMTVRARARHLMLRANPHCHRTRSASSFQLILNTRPFRPVFQCTHHILSFTLNTFGLVSLWLATAFIQFCHLVIVLNGCALHLLSNGRLV